MSVFLLPPAPTVHVLSFAAHGKEHWFIHRYPDLIYLHPAGHGFILGEINKNGGW